MRFGLDDNKIAAIVLIISKYQAVKKAVIFGSRARGDYQYNSDIDIAIYTNGESVTGLVHAGNAPGRWPGRLRRVTLYRQ